MRLFFYWCKLNNILDHDLSREVYGDLISEVREKIKELIPSKKETKKIQKSIWEQVNDVFAKWLDFMSWFKNVVNTSLDEFLEKIERPRDIDYKDIEFIVEEIKLELEDSGLKFPEYDDTDSYGNKNDFDRNFKRDIVSSVLCRYLTSFWIKWDKDIDTWVRLKKRLHNILHEPILEELLVELTEQGLIQLSDNLWNKFTKELEQKILDVDKNSIVSQLDEMEGVRKTFEWQVTDEYYDFPDNRLHEWEYKSSFRIRKKENALTGEIKYYYTAKRKDTEAIDVHGYRDCWEEEYEILESDYNTTKSIVTDIGMYKSREKTKYRTSYAHDKDRVKFDIDEYKWIPTVLEIEAESGKNIEKYKKKLWVDNPKINPTSAKGSSWLFRHYEKIMKKFKPYNLKNTQG